jgi:hypothetical protein
MIDIREVEDKELLKVEFSEINGMFFMSVSRPDDSCMIVKFDTAEDLLSATTWTIELIQAIVSGHCIAAKEEAAEQERWAMDDKHKVCPTHRECDSEDCWACEASQLRAELDRLKDELFDAREEGAADEAYMEKLLVKNVDLHNATVTMRVEMDRMTAAVMNLQSLYYNECATKVDEWIMETEAEAHKIREKYRFDKKGGKG